MTQSLAEWKGFANSTEFRAGHAKVLEVVRDTRAASLILDNRRLEGVTPPDQLWIRDTFAKSMEAAGLRRLALVVAHHGLARIAIEEIRTQTAKSAIVTRTFGTVSEAIEWVGASAE